MSGPLGYSGGAGSAIVGLVEMISSVCESFSGLMEDVMISKAERDLFLAVTCSDAGGTSQSHGSTSGQQSQQSSTNTHSGWYSGSRQRSGQSAAAAGAPNDPPRDGFGKRKIQEYERMELRMGVLNARSIRKFLRRLRQRSNALRELLIQSRLDVLPITETWLRENSLTVDAVARLLPPEYRIFSVPRAFGRGGGVAIVYRSDIECREIRFQETATFEYVATAVIPPGFWQEVVVLNIYRPPSGNLLDFLNEYRPLLQSIFSRYQHVVIVGDFNVRVNSTDSRAAIFEEEMNDHDLEQFVMEPTRGANILDLVFARPDVGINRVSVQDNTFSDHRTVLFRVNIMLKVDEVKRLRRSDKK